MEFVAVRENMRRAELAERYETLRKRVSGSISQLDDLIEGLKR